MDNRVNVVSLKNGFAAFERAILKKVLAILEVLKKNNVSVDVYLTGAEKMRFLNKKFRGIDKATDILSFEEPISFPHPEIAEKTRLKPIGEIYIDLRKTKDYYLITKNGRKNSGNDFFTIDHLLVHSILHLFGHSHKTKVNREKMENKEKKLIKKIKQKL